MADAREGHGERVQATLFWSAGCLLVAALLWILLDVAWRGLGHLSLEFVTEDPADAGRAGGIRSVLVSTMLILGVCLAAALPVGVGTAVLIAELAGGRGTFGRWVGHSLDALAAVPSIVFGLFGNALFCQALGMGYSILSGGLTLACMVLPVLIRTTEQALRAVPAEHRLGALALGMRRTTLLRAILLPAAAPGVAAGLVLGIGRAVAETAALIFTSGYVTRMPGSLLDSGRALSVHVYDLSMNVPGGNDAAYASALLLVGLLVLVNGAALSILGRWARRKLT